MTALAALIAVCVFNLVMPDSWFVAIYGREPNPLPDPHSIFDKYQ